MRIDSAPRSVGPSSSSSSYVEPLDGEALGRGHCGPLVLALQKQLNAMGASPPLVLDGKLGPKTEAAMQKLLTAPAPAGDVFQQEPVATPAVETPTPFTASPGSGELGQRVVDQAHAENDSINPMKRGDDGKVKGWQQLQTVFEKTTGWRPTDAQCQDVQPGRGLQPGGKSWCGIWACHIYQQAGVDCRWDLNKGSRRGSRHPRSTRWSARRSSSRSSPATSSR
jgi:hypothetical protein